ncbi:DNA repair protein RecN [Halalkalibacillus halophilus]|uniref:DNA repair protein RecN n=1 Tax=Halalkalibacillus halophilus TaxID=392827 RepID=UPI000420772D|nr:DNA repair protein RecN [Halalkalibacillus halophilus]
MLAQISIKNFAIIDEITLNFNDGLTVLTGETGAGKSIIIDAIQLLAGARASVEFVRHEAEQASIEGIFFIDKKDHIVYDIIKEYELPLDEEGSVIIERFITSKGKSICRVNGKLVTLAILKEVGSKLVDIHSQHETQSLMNPENHLHLLDQFQYQLLENTYNNFYEQYKELLRLEKRYQELTTNEQEIAQRVDLLKFQYNELEEAQLEPGEDELLEKEKNQLANYEKVFENLQAAYEPLNGEQSGLDFIGHSMSSLENLEDVDASYEELSQQMKSYYFGLEEIASELRNKIEQLEFQPNRLEEVESRLFEINRLKRKYGKEADELLSLMAEMEEELDKLNNKDSHLQELEKEIEGIQKDALIEADQLHQIRVNIAKELTTAILEELKGLYLDKSDFEIDFHFSPGKYQWKGESVNLTKNGLDQVQFLISTNPGEPVKALQKVASGGEISRIMLALKSIFSKHQQVTSVIFDEVDTGVSGRVALSIAQKIHDISADSQVLCITHLPQVAAMADHHYLIEKEFSDQDHTSTTVNRLSKEQSAEEIGRMISGQELTDTTKQHAEELIKQAHALKK